MSSIRWHHNGSDVYLYVNGRWYRYLCTSTPIGEGAMGVVYLGFDCITNEKVAVKMLRQEFWNNQQIRNRMRLEASITINHPNIIRMIGYCEDSSRIGPLYVLSEYVYGVTFKEHIEQLSNIESNRGLKYKKIVAEFLPVMDAVEYLHSLGIIHRDIKPANLMLQDGHLLKLMDLGVAKADYFFDAHLKGFVGTMPFAAPEQIVDDNTEANIDHRADIYALGVTLSFLLVGHYPINSFDKVPKTLECIIMKATASDLNERYQHAHEMRNSVCAYLLEKRAGKPLLLAAVATMSIVVILITLFSIIIVLNK